MILYSMTATFGKLEHETLTLHKGLNLIEAPNEWGKSTWCAFLVTMFYGLETRVHSTKTSLADKDHYAPWSGSPMSGRIDLNWNGRDITIERRSNKARPMSEFRAYETQTGLNVPELTAANCGQQLLGVERGVFLRAGFLRLQDLPVTQDETLRRRLNALVTTADESAAGDLLAQKLKDLKNKCLSNRSGLIPKAQSERAALETQLRELKALQAQSDQISRRQAQLEAEAEDLNNHSAALAYRSACEDERRVSLAKADCEAARARITALEAQCASLAPRAVLEQETDVLQRLLSEQAALHAQPAPNAPTPPADPYGLAGVSEKQANADRAEYEALSAPVRAPVRFFSLCGALLTLAGGALLAFRRLWGLLPLAAGIALLAAALLVRARAKRSRALNRRRADAIAARYAPLPPQDWAPEAARISRMQADYVRALEEYKERTAQESLHREALAQRLQAAAGALSAQEALNNRRKAIASWDELGAERREYAQAVSHLQAVQAMANSALPPAKPDFRTESAEQTRQRLLEISPQIRQLQLQLGHCLGQMDRLGSEESIQTRLQAVNDRIARLTDYYAAATIAQEALADASAELQRRFSPQITRRALELFSSLTGQRYNRLTLDQDLSVQAGAQGEDTLRSALWRSDGTTDQLYIALRLAVAQELTPDAPLILDDVFARFDDRRLAAAMDVLRDEAERKQVLVFTCQSRERAAAQA